MKAVAATLVDLRWERIQVIARLRPAADAGLDPSAIRLVRTDDPAVGMPATRAWSADGDVLARFNVMNGPGAVPLEPGRWVLSVAEGGRPTRPRPLEVAPGAEVEGARFDTHIGEYVVEPSVAEGELRLDVDIRPLRPERARSLRPTRPLVTRLARTVVVSGFAFLYRIARRLWWRDPNRILFVGHYGTELSGDMQAVLTRIAERGLGRGRRISTLPPLRKRGVRAWLRAPRELARAGVIVIEEDVLYMLWPLDARVIQLWHASGALKTIGFSRIGKSSARSPWGPHYRYFTYAIVSGEHDVPLFAEAFGMPEERVLPLGHPRMDRFFDEGWRQQAREATLEAIPEARGRRVILFAPTWRPSRGQRVYDLSILDYGGIHELCVDIDAVFIIRLHPTVTHPVEIPAEYRDRIINGTTSVMDAPDQLCAADLLITDYSSIILEYALLGRPMLFFAPDLETYRADRDVYMPYEEFVPGRIVQTCDELVAAIRSNDFHQEKVGPFAASQFTYQDGGATDRVVDLVLGR